MSSLASLRVLSPADLNQFHSEGYLVVENVVDRATIQELLQEMNDEVLTPLAQQLLNKGKLHSLYSDIKFEDRIQRVSAESSCSYPQAFDFSLPQSGITRQTPLYLGDKLFQMFSHSKIVDCISDILGTEEISSNPVQHMRIKLPAKITEEIAKNSGFSGMVNPVPWHQDSGVILPESDNSHIITCWLALSDVTLDSGCMQVIPKSHNQQLFQHCHTKEGLAINDKTIHSITTKAEESEKLVMKQLPMTAGSILLMTCRTIHSSAENTTANKIRVSMDLRYQKTGTASGRPLFDSAGFVVRSAANPSSVLTEATEWRARWLKLRESLAEQNLASNHFNRWDINAPGCA
jgi:phytanoyl-CoA hydroxylase